MVYEKGWASPKAYRCRATHYVHPVTRVYSLCGRSPIRFTIGSKAHRALEVCDFCQFVRRKK